MITRACEYEKAQAELQQLEDWLARLNKDVPLPEKGLTRVGIRNMIVRLHGELGDYEATMRSNLPDR